MDEIKIKQQVIEKIKASSKILVTVSDSPSVDALSAALGLTLLLDKQEKYATAIFSGETPPAIAFLEPEKTFDDTTDSLRDFIIALNKEKADHLRYKVEGESVKIFITPYKTVINEDDLEFSQGDYNVELVIALGVDNQESLDAALDNHGQILHDAEIITMTAGEQMSELGGIDWHDGGASSLSEMVAGLVDSFKDEKKKSLLDAPIATALLTGIVAQTERFSNERTTSNAMTIAAKLMSAGADQQLIATELQQSQEIPEAEEPEVEQEASDNGSGDDESAGDSTSDNDEAEIASDGTMTIKKDGLSIDHSGETLADLDSRVRGHKKSQEKIEEEREALEDNLEEEAKEVASTKIEQSLKSTKQRAEKPKVETALPDEITNPSLGGTLNATTEQAADDARREEASDKNRTILSHSYLGGNSTDANQDTDNQNDGLFGQNVAPGSVGVNEVPTNASEPVHSAYSFDAGATPASEDTSITNGQSFASSGEKIIQPLSDAQPVAAPVTSPEATPVATTAYAAPEVTPQDPVVAPAPAAASPADLGLPLPPPLPDFTQINGAAPALPLPPTQQPEILGDILTQDANQPQPAVSAAPAPAYGIDPSLFAAQPAAPVEAPVTAAAPIVSTAPASAYATPVEQTPVLPPPADPGQFKIPGQA